LIGALLSSLASLLLLVIAVAIEGSALRSKTGQMRL
jgi:hypothetical protein